MIILLTLALGSLSGLALGLTGGGGSLFTLPLLVYVLGVAPADAAVISLTAVALMAAWGAALALRARLVAFRAGLIFAVAGMVTTPVGLGANARVSAATLLTLFSLLMLAIAVSMWRRLRVHPAEAGAVRARLDSDAASGDPMCGLSPDGRLVLNTPCAVALAAAGAVTGWLSGFFGVGGGFLIVPALITVTRLGIHRAVATSLFVISLISGAGFVMAQSAGRSLDWATALPFLAGGLLGMGLGRRYARRISGPALQQGFAAALAVTGAAMLVHTYWRTAT